MRYVSLEDYARGWIFRHHELPVPAEDLALIRPLAEPVANQIWSEWVSKENLHPEDLGQGDWAGQGNSWSEPERWQERWESEKTEMPEAILEHLQWEDNTVVFFCYEADHVIETTWAVFRRHWKNFLFFDNGPMLMGRKRKQVVQFNETGNFRLAERP